VPAVEEYGVEPIPAELRTVGWRDLFAITFTFFLNPVMYILGGLAVLEGGLPLLWAIAAMVLGQALAFAALVVVARPGVDDGLPGQVAMRATFGLRGARGLTSPYRMIAATYWFAAQALTAAFGIQAIVAAMGGGRPPLVVTSLAVAAVQGALAVLGFDVMRWLLRVVLPFSVLSAGVIVGLYLSTDDPAYALDRVVGDPEQEATWVGFATFVSVMCGSSLTLVTNIADLCRYTATRRDMQVGLVSAALLSAAVTTFVGGYAAAASGDTNPFVAVSELASSELVLAVLLAAIVVQTLAANLANVYTAGLSLVNTAPRLGRFRATVLAATAAIVLSAFPSFIEEAQRWVTHLGNVAAPITGIVLADYLIRQRGRLDVDALYDPSGRYRYLRGVNVEAVAAVACGITAYYAVPQSWLKVAWGAGAAALTYVVLSGLRRWGASRPARMQWMRAPSSGRTVLVVGGAVVAAGVATAVALVATAHSRTEPTRAEYLAGVAAICRVFGPKLDVIRPPDVAEPANVIAAVERVLPLVKTQLGRVRRLEPPRELRHQVQRWLVLQQRRLGMLEKAHAAGRRQDFRALSIAYVDFLLAGPETSRLGRALGIPHPPC
jgi:NCS1 family nucleobase:cation symporter-1